MITFKLNEKWITVRSLLQEENRLLLKKKNVRMERELNEIKKCVIILEDLKVSSQSYIPLKECAFYWVEGLCLSVWLGGREPLGWDLYGPSQLSE